MYCSFINSYVALQGQPGMQGEPGGPGPKGDKGFAGRDGESGFDGAPGEAVCIDIISLFFCKSEKKNTTNY